MSDHLPKDADEARRAGVNLRELSDKAWRTNGAAPDPFLIPDEFKGRKHCRQWVEALVAAVVSQETAQRAVDAFNASTRSEEQSG